MSKLKDLIPEGMSIRQVTLEDRDEVIEVHDNVKDGTDRLPAYYNYWLSLPEVYAVGLFDEKKMVGFFSASPFPSRVFISKHIYLNFCLQRPRHETICPI